VETAVLSRSMMSVDVQLLDAEPRAAASEVHYGRTGLTSLFRPQNCTPNTPPTNMQTTVHSRCRSARDGMPRGCLHRIVGSAPSSWSCRALSNFSLTTKSRINISLNDTPSNTLMAPYFTAMTECVAGRITTICVPLHYDVIRRVRHASTFPHRVK